MSTPVDDRVYNGSKDCGNRRRRCGNWRWERVPAPAQTPCPPRFALLGGSERVPIPTEQSKVVEIGLRAPDTSLRRRLFRRFAVRVRVAAAHFVVQFAEVVGRGEGSVPPGGLLPEAEGIVEILGRGHEVRVGPDRVP